MGNVAYGNNLIVTGTGRTSEEMKSISATLTKVAEGHKSISTCFTGPATGKKFAATALSATATGQPLLLQHFILPGTTNKII